MTFEHYIITRFNLPIFQPKVEGKILTSCSEDYLQYRFDLFERYCMPSIINQTCQNFKWLVLFDNKTPDVFKNKVSQWHSEYPNLIPCYLNTDNYQSIPIEYLELCNKYESIVENKYNGKRYDLATFEQERPLRLITPLFIKDAIKQCSDKIPDYYITTRIDNDDAFHKDMIAIVQQKFLADPKPVVFDFVYTYKYILNEGIVYRYPLKNGHFISLVESSEKPFQSAIYWNHLYIESFVEVEHIYQQPLQTELIHGNNVVNDFTELTIRGMIYAVLHFRMRDFGYSGTRISYARTFRILAFLIKKKLFAGK